MNLGLKINKIPLELGAAVSPEILGHKSFRRNGVLRRLLSRHAAGHTVYDGENCELEGLDDNLHIYPCTHSYLDRDRRWCTRVTLFIKNDRLQRILFQVIEGQTAALNFVERFTNAATAAIGQPSHTDRYITRWQKNGAHIEAKLHPNRINADFDIVLAD